MVRLAHSRISRSRIRNFDVPRNEGKSWMRASTRHLSALLDSRIWEIA